MINALALALAMSLNPPIEETMRREHREDRCVHGVLLALVVGTVAAGLGAMLAREGVLYYEARDR